MFGFPLNRNLLLNLNLRRTIPFLVRRTTDLTPRSVESGGVQDNPEVQPASARFTARFRKRSRIHEAQGIRASRAAHASVTRLIFFVAMPD